MATYGDTYVAIQIRKTKENPDSQYRTRPVWPWTRGVRIEKEGSSNQECTLKIVKNLYGQKQAGRVWYQFLKKGLLEIGFKLSKVDKCVFYYKKSVLLVYIDNSIIIGPALNEIQKIDIVEVAIDVMSFIINTDIKFN